LERISEENRLTERELETLTLSLLPGIYGALLDLLVVALRNLPETQPAKLPRMADFYELCIAAGIPSFVEAYAANLETGNQAAVEANPLTDGILALLDAHDGYWEGTATELVQRLQALDPTSREFQKLSASSVGKRLSASLKSDLAAVGVKVVQGKGNKGQRFLTLSKVSQEQRVASQPTQTPTPSPDKEEEQSPPIALPSVTPEKNNGAAVPSTPSSASAPVKPEVAALQSDNGRLQRTTNGAPPTSNTAKEEDHISKREWDNLLDACCKAGVSHLDLRQVISEAAGIPMRDVGVVTLTRVQYRRAMAYLANYQK
jgi:hypothetical protein